MLRNFHNNKIRPRQKSTKLTKITAKDTLKSSDSYSIGDTGRN